MSTSSSTLQAVAYYLDARIVRHKSVGNLGRKRWIVRTPRKRLRSWDCDGSNGLAACPVSRRKGARNTWSLWIITTSMIDTHKGSQPNNLAGASIHGG
jgi:hypothetical protein